jgi:general secretion pathway protein A
MYNQFFGVHKAPFNLTADPDFLYLTAQHREALAGLSYAILARKGFVVLTGTAGTGKTTLLTRIMQQLPPSRVQYSVILNPTLSTSEFLEAALMDFGLKEIPISKAQRISKLLEFLWKAHQTGRISALIVDEAHKLSLDVLEEIRLLGNFESGGEKLLQIALVGQGELDDVLNSEPLWQFKQRIARRMIIKPLAADEVGLYIQYRWAIAGGKEAPFSAEAVASIGQATQGIPRLINVTCDNALIEAYADESVMVEARHVKVVCRDLQLSVRTPLLSPLTPQRTAAPQATAAVRNIDADPMNMLERYSTMAPQRPSLLGRLRNKLKLTQRIETA